jgi:hypothetical protein
MDTSPVAVKVLFGSNCDYFLEWVISSYYLIDLDGKKVRFSRVAEVREMSAREALHANLARLSYAASIRAAAALRRAADR